MLHRIILFVLVLVVQLFSQEFLISYNPCFYLSYDKVKDKVYATNSVTHNISLIDRKTGTYIPTGIFSNYVPILFPNKSACLYISIEMDSIRFHDFTTGIDTGFLPALIPNNSNPSFIYAGISFSPTGKNLIVANNEFRCYDLSRGPRSYKTLSFPFLANNTTSIDWETDSTLFFFSYCDSLPALFRLNVATGKIDTLNINSSGYINRDNDRTMFKYYPSTKRVMYLLTGKNTQTPIEIRAYSTELKRDTLLMSIPENRNTAYPIAFSGDGKFVAYEIYTPLNDNSISVANTENKTVFNIRTRTNSRLGDMIWVTNDTLIYSSVATSWQGLYGFSTSLFSEVKEEIRDAGRNKIVEYPNPVKGMVHFYIPGNITGTAELSVYSILGEKVIRDTEITFSAGRSLFDLSSFLKSPGVYLYQISFKNEKMQPYSGKIVLQK